MKTSIKFFILTLFLIIMSMSVFGALTDGLTSYYSFDVDTRDAKGIYNLTNTGATFNTTTPKIGTGAYSCDSGDRLRYASYSPFTGYNYQSNYSISLWMRPHDVTTDKQFVWTIVEGNDQALVVNYGALNNNLNYFTGNGIKISNSSFSQINNWIHVVIVKYSNATAMMYQNGVFVGSGQDNSKQ